MKILWLSHLVPYPPKGGVLQRSFNMVKEISKGNDLHLVCFVQSGMFSHVYPDMETAYSETKNALGEYCEKIEYLPIPCEESKFGKYFLALKSLVTIDPFTVNWLKSAKMHELLRKLSLEHDYDIVHFDTISLIPFLKYFPESKKVLDHHNIESHMMFRRTEEETNFLKRLYYKLEAIKLQHSERKYCSQFDLNITCSKLDSDRLLEILPNKINVIDVPNGADTEYFKANYEVDKTPASLIFAGGLNWYPNVKAIMFFVNEVWPKLKEKLPNVVFNLVGQYPTEELLNLAKVDSNFKVHGFVDDVRVVMDQSWIYVCPINDGGGTKLKILDALAMSKTIVANPISCEGIDVTDGVDVCFASTADEYTNKIVALLDDPDKCKTIGLNARKLIESKYSYKIIGENIRELYKSLLD